MPASDIAVSQISIVLPTIVVSSHEAALILTPIPVPEPELKHSSIRLPVIIL